MPPRTTDLGWLRGPVWDACLLAFGWVPFYLWVAATPVAHPDWGEARGSLATALVIALGLNFLHRHYVLLLVYGDRESFDEHPRAYILAPMVALAVVASSTLSGLVGAKEVMLGALGTWNVWHVIQQRYGILRAYAARARGGLESREAAAQDFRLLWAAVLVTAPIVLLVRRAFFESRPESARIFAVVGTWLSPPVLAAALAACTGLFVLALVAWIRTEASARPSARLPRYLFLASTFALLGVFVVHGPVVGYLVFGVAHSVEYLAFVHHFGERKYMGAVGPLAARALGDVRRAPLLLAPLFLAYVFLHAHRFTLAYVTYFSTTSTLHYLYDGWIWRLRQPKVAQTLIGYS